MKVTELQKDRFYVCYDEQNKYVKKIIHISEVESYENDDHYEICGEIIQVLPQQVYIVDHTSATCKSNFKEITERQYAEILNKYKAFYSAVKKLMQD